MTLPSSGALSISAINTEFARGNNLNAYRGTTWYTDAGATGTFSAGAINMSDFYSKRLTSPAINVTISTNSTNVNLFTLAGSPAGVVTVNCTINSGVFCYATNVSNYGFRTGAFAAGSTITITNNGNMIGCGGNGANAPAYNGIIKAGLAGAGGSPGFLAEVNCTINGTGNIRGGGGGGGSGGDHGLMGPGGGGGGQSYQATSGGTSRAGRGPYGVAGNNGAGGSNSGPGAGGAGGSALAVPTGGERSAYVASGNGGNGGNYGIPGSNGTPSNEDGVPYGDGGAGGAAGAAINRNGKTVSYSGQTLSGAVVG